MSKSMRQILILAAALTLGACATSPDADDAAGDDTGAGQQTQGSDMDTSGVDARDGGRASALSEQEARDQQLRQQRIVYFDFDSSQIRQEFVPVLDAHARHLRDNPSARIRLEGHTDERGTREYNIALGERRAEAVRRALLLRGAARAQLLTVSYGEEQPAVLGSGESIWSQNRRVEMVYQ